MKPPERIINSRPTTTTLTITTARTHYGNGVGKRNHSHFIFVSGKDFHSEGTRKPRTKLNLKQDEST